MEREEERKEAGLVNGGLKDGSVEGENGMGHAYAHGMGTHIHTRRRKREPCVA